MSCTCTKTKTLPAYMSDLLIGTISEHNTDVIVYFRCIDGRIQMEATTSDNTGQVIVDLSNVYFPADIDFEVWVTDDGVDDKLPINIGGTNYDCLLMTFETIFPVTRVTEQQTVEIA